MSIELTTAPEQLRTDISKTLPLYAAYANYFDFESDLTTTITTAGEWVKLNTDTTSGFTRNGLTHTNNRITYSGPATVFQLLGIASLTSSPNVQINIAFFKNGELWPCSEQDVTTGTGGRANNVTSSCLIELEEGDFVEVYVKNVTSTANVTLDNLNVTVIQL